MPNQTNKRGNENQINKGKEETTVTSNLADDLAWSDKR